MGSSIGNVAPPLVLPDTEGVQFVLDPSLNRATVVVWTCNHCPYALAWHARIQKAARDYAPERVAFVQVNANDGEKFPADAWEPTQERVAKGEFASPYLRDEDQTQSKLWGARVTPDVFVLDSRGVLVYRGAPDSDYNDETRDAEHLRAALDAVLSDAEVDVPYVKPLGCGIKWTVNDQPDPHAD